MNPKKLLEETFTKLFETQCSDEPQFGGVSFVVAQRASEKTLPAVISMCASVTDAIAPGSGIYRAVVNVTIATNIYELDRDQNRQDPSVVEGLHKERVAYITALLRQNQAVVSAINETGDAQLSGYKTTDDDHAEDGTNFIDTISLEVDFTHRADQVDLPLPEPVKVNLGSLPKSDSLLVTDEIPVLRGNTAGLATVQQIADIVKTQVSGADLTAINAAIDALQDDLAELHALATDTAADITPIQAAIDALQAAASSNASKASVDALAASLSTLQALLSALQAQVNQIPPPADLSSIDAAILALQNELASLENVDLEAINAAIQDLQTALPDKASAFDVEALQIAMQALQTQTSDLPSIRTAIADLQLAVANMPEPVDLGPINSSISTLQAQVAGLTISSGRTFWIAPTGNNTTGAVGNIAKPYANLAGVVGSLLDWDSIQILPGDYTGTPWTPPQINKARVSVLQHPGAKILISGNVPVFGTTTPAATNACTGCSWTNLSAVADFTLNSTGAAADNAGALAWLRSSETFSLQGGMRWQNNSAQLLHGIRADNSGTGGLISVNGPLELHKGLIDPLQPSFIHTTSVTSIHLRIVPAGKALVGLTLSAATPISSGGSVIGLVGGPGGSDTCDIMIDGCIDNVPATNRSINQQLIYGSGNARCNIEFCGDIRWAGIPTVCDVRGYGTIQIINRGRISLTSTLSFTNKEIYRVGCGGGSSGLAYLNYGTIIASLAAFATTTRLIGSDSPCIVDVGYIQGPGDATYGLLKRESATNNVEIRNGTLRLTTATASYRAIMLTNASGKTRLRNLHLDLPGSTNIGVGGNGAAATDRTCSAVGVSTNGLGVDAAKVTLNAGSILEDVDF